MAGTIKAVSNENLSAFAQALALKVPLKSDLPTKVSDLANDRGFTSNEGTITGITMNGNSMGTSGVIDLGNVVVSEPKPDWNAVSGAAQILNKPSIPTKVSDLINDLGFITTEQDVSGKEDKSNKVTTISSSSTDTQYPTAKAVNDSLVLKQDIITDLPSIRLGAATGSAAVQSVSITNGTMTVTSASTNSTYGVVQSVSQYDGTVVNGSISLNTNTPTSATNKIATLADFAAVLVWAEYS